MAADITDWILYYPDPEFAQFVVVTTANPRIGVLWNLARAQEPSLADHIGQARYMLYVVRSSLLYTTGGCSHL
jgi:hypothetical protein